MTIYLHIGSHKTGTTSIQKLLSRHRDTLAAQGIWYPRDSELLDGAHDSGAHLNIARSLDNNHRRKFYSASDLAKIFEALTSKSRSFHTTIISAEAFWRIGFIKPPKGHAKSNEYYNKTWESKASNIKQIRELLGNSDTTIVATLRERSSYIQSSYSEFILATLYQKNIHRFMKYIRHITDYRRQIEAWQALFPVKVLSYEKMAAKGNLPVDFLQTLAGSFSIQEDQETQQRIHNPGHPIACVAFKRYLNGIANISIEDRNRIYNKARRIFTRSSHKSTPSALLRINSWLTAKEISSVRLQCRSDDDYIRANFCRDFVSGSTHKNSDQHTNLVPWTKTDEHLCLGWMLAKKQPSLSWFTPASE
jgi:hypothetical protein